MDDLRFLESDRDSLKTFLVSNDCDEDSTEEIVEAIENTMIIF